MSAQWSIHTHDAFLGPALRVCNPWGGGRSAFLYRLVWDDSLLGHLLWLGGSCLCLWKWLFAGPTVGWSWKSSQSSHPYIITELLWTSLTLFLIRGARSGENCKWISPPLEAAAPMSSARNLSFPPWPPVDAELLPVTLDRKQTLHQASDDMSRQRASVNSGAGELVSIASGQSSLKDRCRRREVCIHECDRWVLEKLYEDLHFCAGETVVMLLKNLGATLFVKGEKAFYKGRRTITYW